MDHGPGDAAPPSRRAAAELPRKVRWMAYLIGAFGLGITQQANFLVPLRARELGASFEVIGLIVAAGALAPALFSVPMGAVIDRLGPRRSFILGTSICGAVALVFLLVTDYWLLAVLQLLVGPGRTLGWVASQSYITSIGSAEDRPALAGRFSLFSNLGPMLGPLMVGIVAQFVGFRLSFLFIAAYAFAFATLGVLLVDTGAAAGESRRRKQGTGFRTALRLLSIRGIQVALILSFVRLWTEWVWTGFFPVFLVDSGIEPGVAGTVVFAKGLVASLLAPTAGFWVRFADKQTLIATGLGLGALGVVLSPHMATLPLVYAAPLLVGIGAGLSLPLLMAIVSEAAPEGQLGIAIGLRASVNGFAMAAAPVTVGPLLAALGVMAAFAVGGTTSLGLLATALVLHAVDRRSRRR